MSAAVVLLAAAAVCWPSAGAVGGHARLRPHRPFRLPRARALDLAVGPAGVVAAVVLAGVVVAAASTPVVACLAAAGAGLGARAVQGRCRAAGEQRAVRALVEALGVLAAELRAGRSVADATGAAVRGCPEPRTAAVLGPVLRLGEFPRAAAAAPSPGRGAGAPVGEVERALTRVAAAVRLSARTGCSLAGVVTALEDDLRARIGAETELRSAVAGPRASAAVLAGLPVLGLLMGSGVGADPWRVLTTTGTGTVLLLIGVGLEVAGIAWSGRLVRRAVQR